MKLPLDETYNGSLLPHARLLVVVPLIANKRSSGAKLSDTGATVNNQLSDGMNSHYIVILKSAAKFQISCSVNTNFIARIVFHIRFKSKELCIYKNWRHSVSYLYDLLF